MTKQIKILGTGCCSTCATLDKLVRAKAEAFGADVEITKSNDMMEIIAAGIMATPAVIIDGKVVHAGGMPKESEIDKWFV